MANRANSILINPAANVATALAELAPSDLGAFMSQGQLHEITVTQRIPQYHKFAVRDIKRCNPVTQYGEIIGEAIQDIGSGSHVHVHNVASPERSKT
jgi:altronate dehydratase small subunit